MALVLYTDGTSLQDLVGEAAFGMVQGVDVAFSCRSLLMTSFRQHLGSTVFQGTFETTSGRWPAQRSMLKWQEAPQRLASRATQHCGQSSIVRC